MQMQNKELNTELSEVVRQKLQKGNTVDLWWPRHCCSYKGTIKQLSATHVTLVFDDGSLKVMPMTTVAHRIAAAEVCLWEISS